MTNDDFGVERKPSADFSAQLGTANTLPDDERACRPNVDDIEASKLFGKLGRSEGSVTADVESPQENNE
jgi:hypothetical protein